MLKKNFFTTHYAFLYFVNLLNGEVIKNLKFTKQKLNLMFAKKKELWRHTDPGNLLLPADDGHPALVVVHVVPDALVVRKHEPDRVARPLQRPVKF